ncbi:unnamed protein product, partial [Acanthoscelides obtectus]
DTTVQVVATATPEEQTKLKLNKIINLTEDNNESLNTNIRPQQLALSANQPDDGASDWKQVEHRRRRRNVIVGSKTDTEVKCVRSNNPMWEIVRKNKNTSNGMNTSKEKNEFNDFFCTIAHKLLENLDEGELHPEKGFSKKEKFDHME